MDDGDVVGGGDIGTCVREAILGNEDRSLWNVIDGTSLAGGGVNFHQFAGMYHIRHMANGMDVKGRECCRERPGRGVEQVRWGGM